MGTVWYLEDPRDDKEYQFATFEELAKWMLKNCDAGDSVTVWHSHEL